MVRDALVDLSGKNTGSSQTMLETMARSLNGFNDGEYRTVNNYETYVVYAMLEITMTRPSRTAPQWGPSHLRACSTALDDCELSGI